MMNLPSTFKISLRALRVNKMRSALTMLGIIIGVAAVIIMIAIGKGTSDKLSKEIATVGSNIIYVRPGSSIAGGVRGGMGTEMTLTRDDAVAIERECSAVLLTAPIISGVAQIVYSNQNWATSVQGTTDGMLEARDWTLYSGRNFTEQDIRNATKVCILGQTVAENLFGGINPLNQTVRIKKVPFTVVGILDTKGQSMMGHDQDDIIFIPITTSQKRIFGTTLPGIVHTILVKARSSEDLSRAESQINDLLRQRHRIRPNQEDDFSVRNLTQMLALVESTAKAMALLLAAIASISLLVGGIGIMNIMLVSVTERTREIGIRMAVGAKTWDIRMQFIIEAITLSIIGGIIGIILGIIASKLLSVFANLTTIISPFAVFLAVGFSGLVGIFFGFYPAYKASLLNPIDALRYE